MYNTTPPGSSSLTWIAHKKKMILVKVAPNPPLSLQRIRLSGGLLPVSVREIPFPTPAYTQDPFATFVKSVFGLFFVPLANTRDIFWGGYVGVGQRGLHCLMPFKFSTFLNSIPWQLTPKSTSKTHPNTKGNDLPKLWTRLFFNLTRLFFNLMSFFQPQGFCLYFNLRGSVFISTSFFSFCSTSHVFFWTSHFLTCLFFNLTYLLFNLTCLPFNLVCVFVNPQCVLSISFRLVSFWHA